MNGGATDSVVDMVSNLPTDPSAEPYGIGNGAQGGTTPDSSADGAVDMVSSASLATIDDGAGDEPVDPNAAPYGIGAPVTSHGTLMFNTGAALEAGSTLLFGVAVDSTPAGSALVDTATGSPRSLAGTEADEPADEQSPSSSRLPSQPPSLPPSLQPSLPPSLPPSDSEDDDRNGSNIGWVDGRRVITSEDESNEEVCTPASCDHTTVTPHHTTHTCAPQACYMYLYTYYKHCGSE